MTVNPPLPTYDMMTGQLLTSTPKVSANAAAMTANHADVVHVQLLDRMIVVPRAIVNSLQGPILRNKITSPDGQAPIDQQGEAYLLFVDWKNFNPLLEYMCGNPVQLPSDKSDLLQLKNTARKFEAREFERLVTRHVRRLHGGGCSPFACMLKPSRQMANYSKPATTSAQLMPRAVQQQQQQQPASVKQAHASLQQEPIMPAPVSQAPAKQAQVQAKTHKAMPTSSGSSMFSRARPAKHHRAEKALDTRQNQLYVAANTQQPLQIFDLQQPLIV